jgi:hypothetical protein
MSFPDKDTVALDQEELDILDAIRQKAPRHHIGPKLAQTYGVWTVCFRRYCHEQTIPWLWMSSVSDFMDFLDAHPNVSPAERNRALDGIMFYITDVHQAEQEATDEDDETDASIPRSTKSLFAKMLLHCDVPLTRALRLRRKDVRLDEAEISVPGDGDRDSETISLPSALQEGLRDHVRRVEKQTSSTNPLLFARRSTKDPQETSEPDTEEDLDRSTALATRVMKTFGDEPPADNSSPDSSSAPSNEKTSE